MGNIETCLGCKDYNTCKKPCKPVEKQLNKGYEGKPESVPGAGDAVRAVPGYKGFNSKREVLVEHDKLPFLHHVMEVNGLYETEFFGRDDFKRIDPDLSCLNETQRFIVERYFWKGESHRDIAKRLGMTHQAVTEYMHSALTVLRIDILQLKLFPVEKNND